MKSGLDYLIIDLEHHTHGTDAIADACAIGRRLDFPILIRPRPRRWCRCASL